MRRGFKPEDSPGQNPQFSLQPEGTPRKRRLILTLALFAGFVILFAVFLFGGWKVYSNTRVAEQVGQDTELISYIAARTQRDFRILANDILALATELEQGELRDGGDLAARDDVADKFMWLARVKENYDKIRIFDPKGGEIFRVNQTTGGPVRVAEGDLQQKGHRPFLQAALQLGPDEFYISPIELNVDFGEVERPLRPVVRALAPVNGPPDNSLRGLVAINMDARPLLEFMEDFFLRERARFHVVSGNGQWIMSPTGENEWSRDLGQGAAFPDRFPEIWRAVNARDIEGETLGGKLVVSGKIRIVPSDLPKVLQGERPAFPRSAQRFVSHFYVVSIADPPTLAGALGGIPAEGYGIFAALSLALLVLSAYMARLLEARLSAVGKIEEQALFQQTVLDTMMEALVVIDEKGIVLAINKAGRDVFGYKPEEVIGNKVNMLMNPKDRRDHDQYIARYMKTGRGRIIGKPPREVAGLTKEGREVDLELAVNAVSLRGKRLFVGSLRDITTRKRALQRTFAELEQFAYVASHDLKAPLRAIDNLSQWIEEDLGPKLKGDAKKNMHLLRGRVRRLENLLDDTLAYSRAGRIKGETAKIDVNQIIEDVRDMLGLAPGFEIAVPRKLPTVKAPKGALEQIFSNLIGNAVKHHDKAKGTITITAKEVRGGWEFAVEDDGPGIPEEYHERVFRMFQTLKGRDRAEGSGMGLAIVRKIVAAQGGDIRLEDGKRKRGTKIVFTWKKRQPKQNALI